MTWNWNEIGLWFITAFVGAGLAKLIDLAGSRYLNRQVQVEKKTDIILAHIKEYGELTTLFRFLSYSKKVVTDADGKPKQDASGNFIVEKRILEPETRFDDAVKALKGADIETAIVQKIASIRLNSSEALDTAAELDPTGELKKQLSELYTKTISIMEAILQRRGSATEENDFITMVQAIKNADEFRQKLRIDLKKFTK